MKKYIGKRMMIAILTLLAIVLLLFLMLELMPGTPFHDERLTLAQKEVLSAKYGLDQPLFIRFLRYVTNMLSGDFGISYSISPNTAITTLLKSRLPVSLKIGGQTVLLGTLIGLMLGIVAALEHNRLFDTIASVISVLGVSLPSYVFALMLSYYFGYHLGIFPLLYNAGEAFRSSVLPSVSLSMLTIATVARFTRSELLAVLDSEYLIFAECKGISALRLILVHALRNAMIPIITVLAPLVVGLMTGSLVVEKIFSIPGIGSLLVTAIASNDYNVVLAIMFVYSAMYIGIMLVVDLLYGVIDPRIRISTGEKFEK